MKTTRALVLGLCLILAAACQPPVPPSPTPTIANTPVAAATPTPSPTLTPTPAPTATAIPLNPSDLMGNWIGGFTLANQRPQHGYLLLTLTAEAEGVAGVLTFPLERTTRNLEDVTFSGDSLTFTWADGDISYQFTIRPDGADLRGVVTQGEQSGDLWLMRQGELPPDELGNYLGLYAAAPDTLIGLHTNGDELWIRDFATGRRGELRPLADNRFILGAGSQLFYPVAAILTFVPDGQGQMAQLTWTPTDGSPVITADRLPEYLTEEEVNFSNGKVTLAGTFLVPTTPGPHPAIIMIHGSEQASRKMGFYRILAEWLVREGLAVLLYDKRGVGDSTGVYQEFANDSNLNNLAGDGLAGVEWLKNRAEVDPTRIGVMGASQAGWVGPRMAAQSPDVAFMVLMVGPTISPAQESLYEQLDGQRRLGMAEWTEEEITAQVLAAASSPFDPLPYLEPLTIPVLWLYGGLDKSIPTYASMAVLEQLNKPNFTVHLFPTGNHGLLDAQTGYDEEYPYLSHSVPGFYQVVAEWLGEIVNSGQ